MANFSVHNTLYEENGGFCLTKEECGILLRKKKSSAVYCPGEGDRAPGAMYPRCICLSHNGEKNGTLLATFECYTYSTPTFPIYESVMMRRAGTDCRKSKMKKRALDADSSPICWNFPFPAAA